MMLRKGFTNQRHKAMFPRKQLLTKLKTRSLYLVAALFLLMTGCSTDIPRGMTAVTPFDINRYAGTWYEIARLDHSFERGLTDVSATYTFQADASIEVLNRGFDSNKNAFKEAKGKALFTGSPQTGSLKVSFFGPFYGGYHVIALDQTAYQWAMIAGPDVDYLWILARDKTLDNEVKKALLTQAKTLGFATDKLIWVAQTQGTK
jgi:apolipoprotein D and lipocalin family protein